jgi:hypothetical protein
MPVAGDPVNKIITVVKLISAKDPIEVYPRGAFRYFNIKRLPLKPQL